MRRAATSALAYALWSSAMVALAIGAMIYLALVAFYQPEPDIELLLLHLAYGVPFVVVGLLFLRLKDKLFGASAPAIGRTTRRFALLLAGTVWGLTWLVLDKTALSIVFLLGSGIAFSILGLDIATNREAERGS